MILESIRLHPFGGTIDRTYDVGRPVAVVIGPNEAGKSTMRHAIHHAFFTPTRLTEADAKKTVARWYPRPDGDHAAVTLVFEHEGTAWRLEKRWGAAAESRLTPAGGTPIRDAESVQRKLSELLGHNEATGRLVLSTGQAELVRTLEALGKAKPGDLPQVTDVMAAAAGAAGDVGPERLRAALEEKIDAFFGHWDRAARRPERDTLGRERGPANPWHRNVGAVLEAWYQWQRTLEELQSLRRDEREFDRVSVELADLESRIAADREFLTAGGSLRAGLGRRTIVELTLAGLRDVGRGLADAATGWPVAEAAIAAAEKTLAILQEQQKKLAEEKENSLRRDENARKRDEFANVIAAKEAWEAAQSAVAESFRPTDEALAKLEELVERVRDARARIEALRLAYRIRASRPITARIEEGNEPPREVALGDDVSGVARARLRIEAGPVTLTVTSGEKEVESLFRVVERDGPSEAQLLAECRAASLAEAKARAREHDGLVAIAERKRGAYEGRLGGKTLEAWEAEIRSLESVPQTRDLVAIMAEIAAVDRAIKTETGGMAFHQANLAPWVEKYRSREALLDLLLENRGRIKELEAELETLPKVPEGFESADAYIAELDHREAVHRERPQEVRALATRRQQLKDAVGDRTVADLEETAFAVEQVFERAVREGRAYERILQAVEAVVAEREIDPQEVFAARVTEYFRVVTGGEDGLDFQNHLPSLVRRGSVCLPPDLLSQGAGAALALALRLALAEVHLGGRRGFIVLDDPFVDLDADRRRRAQGLVRRFTSGRHAHQVIFLTCHEPHAAGLYDEPVGSPPVASSGSAGGKVRDAREQA